MDSLSENRLLFIQKVKPWFLNKRALELNVTRDKKILWSDLSALVGKEMNILYDNLSQAEKDAWMKSKDVSQILRRRSVLSYEKDMDHDKIIQMCFSDFDPEITEAIMNRRGLLLSKTRQVEKVLKRKMSTVDIWGVLRFPIYQEGKCFYPNLYLPDNKIAILIPKDCGNAEYKHAYAVRKRAFDSMGIKSIEVPLKDLTPSDGVRNLIETIKNLLS